MDMASRYERSLDDGSQSGDLHRHETTKREPTNPRTHEPTNPRNHETTTRRKLEARFPIHATRCEDSMFMIYPIVSDYLYFLIHRRFGRFITVHRAFGPGLLERVYTAAVRLELEAEGIAFEKEKRCP